MAKDDKKTAAEKKLSAELKKAALQGGGQAKGGLGRILRAIGGAEDSGKK
jgi:hypothetical protein